MRKNVSYSARLYGQNPTHIILQERPVLIASLQDLMNYSTVDFLLVYLPSTITQAENCPFEP